MSTSSDSEHPDPDSSSSGEELIVYTAASSHSTPPERTLQLRDEENSVPWDTLTPIVDPNFLSLSHNPPHALALSSLELRARQSRVNVDSESLANPVEVTPELVVMTRTNPFFTATPLEIQAFMNLCELPSDWLFKAPLPGNSYNRPPHGYYTFFVDQVISGLRFPIRSDLLTPMDQHDFPINQLAPNGIRILIGYTILSRYHFNELNPEFFFYTYGLKKHHVGSYYLSARNRAEYLRELDAKISHWKTRFFFVKPPNGTFLLFGTWPKYCTEQMDPTHPSR
ncbi:myosin heavy chain-related [Striga hermonthica]|uniref:Myosin heavy chain-related n=1 Tax=Striga hermonthica TaxID=68872 RepID=A0A9N7NUN3_STRHE|nr:myosin heavy chain-related [Striga hermonthica]